MTDDHCVTVATERVVECGGITHQRRDVELSVRRDARGCVAAHERCHRAIAGVGERGQEFPPPEGGVGEAMETKGERSGIPDGEAPVGELVGLDGDGVDRHALTVARSEEV